jgi:uncharacterized protein YcaQ
MSGKHQLVSNEAARLLLLGAQGLLASPKQTATPALLNRLIEQLGFVQIDSINIVERAHHLTLGSRLDSYRREHLTQLLENDRSLFEHWTHDASAVPTKWFSYWKPRFERYRKEIRQNRWWQERIGKKPEKVLSFVRERIANEGPLRSADFEHAAKRGSSAWWGWKPQKAALEYLWSTGELMVLKRNQFQKVYDLTERVLPEHHAVPEPSEEEHVEWACGTALERLVIATPREIAQFWDAISLEQARLWCETAFEASRIVRVVVESPAGEKPKLSFALPDWQERLSSLPAPPDRIRLLCPFDPVLRDRTRLQRLFGFNYRFEAFVPEAKRQYGYFVLPIMERDKLIGRLDPKFDRAEGTLVIRRIDWEPGVRVTITRLRKLDEASNRLAKLIGAHRVRHEVKLDEVSTR